MKCLFCDAEVELGKRCEYCGSMAEKAYYKDINWDSCTRPEPQQERKGTYIVQKGDNLWNIAKRFLGSGSRCYEIARKNNIKNPNLIYPGQTLKI